MKKFVNICILLSLLCSTIYAQDEKKEKSTDWFVGIGGGMNVGFDGTNYETRKDSHIGAGTALDVYFGKYFNNILGFRAGYQGLTISNQCNDYGKVIFNYVHGDLLFRPSNYVIPYLHLGYAYLNSFAGGAGVMFQIPVGKRVEIVPDVKATMYSAGAFGNPAKDCAVNLSGTIGIKVSLGGKSKSRKVVEEPVVNLVPVEPKVDTLIIQVPVVQHDTVIMKENVSEFPPEVIVFFDLNKSTLNPKEASHFRTFVHYVKQCVAQNGKVTLIGSADKQTGSIQRNNQLALERAELVKSVLVNQYGIAAGCIETVSEGGSNNRFDVQEMNRCVYVKF